MANKETNENIERPFPVDLQTTADYFEYLAIDKDENGKVYLSPDSELTKHIGVLAMAIMSFGKMLDTEYVNQSASSSGKPTVSNDGRIDAGELCKIYPGIQEGYKLDFKIDKISEYLKNLKIIQETKGRIQWAIKKVN